MDIQKDTDSMVGKRTKASFTPVFAGQDLRDMAYAILALLNYNDGTGYKTNMTATVRNNFNKIIKIWSIAPYDSSLLQGSGKALIAKVPKTTILAITKAKKKLSKIASKKAISVQTEVPIIMQDAFIAGIQALAPSEVSDEHPF